MIAGIFGQCAGDLHKIGQYDVSNDVSNSSNSLGYKNLETYTDIHA